MQRDFLCYDITWGEQWDEALKWIRIRHMVARSVIENISGLSFEMDSNMNLHQTRLQALQRPMCAKNVLQSFPVTSAPEREEPEWDSW